MRDGGEGKREKGLRVSLIFTGDWIRPWTTVSNHVDNGGLNGLWDLSLVQCRALQGSADEGCCGRGPTPLERLDSKSPRLERLDSKSPRLERLDSKSPRLGRLDSLRVRV